MIKLKLKLRYESFEIPGFSDYSLHCYGDNNFRVWSKPRVSLQGHKCGNCYLTNCLNKGYLVVSLRKAGKPNTIYIHQIVCSVFQPNPENKPTVDHIDRDKLNNRPNNLRWATSTEQNNNQGLRSTNTSGVKGVIPRGNKWTVELTIGGEKKYFGTYYNIEDAAKRAEEIKNKLILKTI